MAISLLLSPEKEEFAYGPGVGKTFDWSTLQEFQFGTISNVENQEFSYVAVLDSTEGQEFQFYPPLFLNYINGGMSSY